MSAGVRAGIYVRISDDRDGHGLGVARQEKDCRALARRLGWTVVEVFTDNDVSASSGKRRPGYERLLAAIVAGEIEAVVVWDVDRLTRRPAELEHIIDLAERHRVQLASVGGEIDLATPQGRLTARIKGNVARHEAEQLSRRVKAKVVELAAAGAIANGGPRPYGYCRIYGQDGTGRRTIIRDEIEPAEAAVVRDAAARLLAGESLRSIVAGLNATGHTTSTGRAWTMQAMRWMLRSGRIAGLREHLGTVVGPAVWPGIITEDMHHLLRARLDSRTRPPGARVRTHWLTGYVFCTGCLEAGRVGRMGVKSHHGTLRYVCAPRAEGGCNGRVVGLHDLQEMVGAYIVGRLDTDEFKRELEARAKVDDHTAAAIRQQIDDEELRLGALGAALATQSAQDMPEAVAALAEIRARVQELRTDLARHAGVPAVVQDAVGLTLPEFQLLHLEAKRALLAFLVQRVLIGPARRGLARFDPARVNIAPR